MSDNRRRIVVAGDFPVAPPALVGGIQAVTLGLVSFLAREPTLDVRAVAREKWWADSYPRRWKTTHDTYTAHYSKSPRRIPQVVTAWTTDARFVQKTALALDASLVHAHGNSGYAIGAIRTGLPCVITPHGMTFREKGADTDASLLSLISPSQARQRLWIGMEQWVLSHATDIIVISPYVKAAIEEQTPARLHMVANPVDDDFFSIARGPGSATKSRLLTVGWLAPRKRHDIMIRALGLLRAEVPDATLEVVGNYGAGSVASFADHFEGLKRLVSDLGLQDAVRFRHHLSHQEVLDAYRESDIYVHSAEEESSPLAVMQAMAAGLPVCAVPIPGLAHLVASGQTGFLAADDSPAALAAVIQQGIEAALASPAVGAAGRADATERFTQSRIAAQTLAVYNEVLAERPAPSDVHNG